ncbi:DNA polymerase III subunit gamma/tau [Candidatus Berkelbacteria bacterium]|nr:DNA polymerase III subunit gamma/tau [Candidatus Berkelbacteria bacterium]
MSSLYRKYRPSNFAEVIGQEHISSNLQTSIKNNRIGHAYLFSGPRGTGKTTFARLFAKAVNCLNDSSVKPCNECAICLEVQNNKAVDIIEIDAASNRGIDEIRALRDTIASSPLRAKYKVYIIDEVHMMTKEAFNALLKTLEEPPAHVIFILATTELHKVPDTILSRCQRFNFHRASDESISQQIKQVAKKEKIEIDDEAVSLIAVRAEGSFRDSLTLLGSVGSSQTKLSYQEISAMLGLPPKQITESLLNSLIEKKPTEAITIVREFISSGGDLVVLVKTLCDQIKLALFSANQPSVEQIKLLEQLLVTLSRSRHSVDPVAIISARLFEIASDGAEILDSRTANIEKSVPAKIATPTSEVLEVEIATEPPMVTDIQKETDDEKTVAVDAVQKPKLAEDDAFWPSFVNQIKNHNHALYAVIRSAALEGLQENKLTLGVRFKFYMDRIMETKNRKLLEKIASDLTGKNVILECVVRSTLNVDSSPADEGVLENVVAVFDVE